MDAGREGKKGKGMLREQETVRGMLREGEKGDGRE